MIRIFRRRLSETNNFPIQLFEKKADLEAYLDKKKQEGLRIGFVPTMGALHDGHTALIRESNYENDISVCSIFVNPEQFNDKEDFKKYPKNLKDDIETLKNEECHVLFTPSYDEIYPEKPNETYDFGILNKVLEGAHRPGHFNGVAQVVSRLFKIVKPHNAYFGLKDFQQYLIIKKLEEKMKLGINIKGVETIREVSGLAMSSRNERLDALGKTIAPAIYAVLKKSREELKNMEDIEGFKNNVKRLLRNYKDIRIEYLEVVDMDTLETVEKLEDSKKIIACIAAWVGNVRLIDNIVLIS